MWSPVRWMRDLQLSSVAAVSILNYRKFHILRSHRLWEGVISLDTYLGLTGISKVGFFTRSKHVLRLLNSFSVYPDGCCKYIFALSKAWVCHPACSAPLDGTGMSVKLLGGGGAASTGTFRWHNMNPWMFPDLYDLGQGVFFCFRLVALLCLVFKKYLL